MLSVIFGPTDLSTRSAGNACLAHEISLEQELEASESPNENKILEPSLFCKGLRSAAAGGAFQVFYLSLSTLPIVCPLHRLIK
jgi:hypothetical protein